MFKASSTSLQYAHIVARIFIVLGIYFVNFNPYYLIGSMVFYHVFMTMGLSVMLHRFFSHHSFKFKNKITEYFCTLISILSMRGSPIAWAYIHRYHHEHVDTEKDPHSPQDKPFKFFGLLDRNKKADQLEIWKIRSLMTKEQIFINQYYWLIILSVILPLGVLNFEIFYYFWLLPIVAVQFGINLQNYLGHMPKLFAYTNFKTKSSGQSQNNILLWPLYLGEAWHNNHHSHSKHFHYGKEISGKWWEYDPGGAFIKLVMKKDVL
jgi:stearoyl-CoA desaturase (delta-9 desaturase)